MTGLEKTGILQPRQLSDQVPSCQQDFTNYIKNNWVEGGGMWKLEELCPSMFFRKSGSYSFLKNIYSSMEFII